MGRKKEHFQNISSKKSPNFNSKRTIPIFQKTARKVSKIKTFLDTQKKIIFFCSDKGTALFYSIFLQPSRIDSPLGIRNRFNLIFSLLSSRRQPRCIFFRPLQPSSLITLFSLLPSPPTPPLPLPAVIDHL